MIVTPSTSPTLVKRRLTPPKLAKPRWITSSAMPISAATPIAASAFWTLCRPGIGRCDAGDRPHLAGAVAQRHVERLPPGTGVDILAAHVGLGGEAVGDDAPVAAAAG